MSNDSAQIASLECQLVVMRGALENIVGWCNCEDGKEYPQPRSGPGFDLAPTIIDCEKCSKARAALSASADYADKVVVDREEWEAMNDCLSTVVSGSYYSGAYNKALARLDALRQQGRKG